MNLLYYFVILSVFVLIQVLGDALKKLEELKFKYEIAKNRSGRELFYNERIEPFEYPDVNVRLDESYDFIVVGSGSAGSVVANRLSEVPEWRVLLLEVGDEATPFVDIPAIAYLFQFTDLNWNYLMEKQENVSLGMVDQRMAWPRGRGLGGSSLINYMIHVRGNRRDYDRWAKMGNPGWAYRDIFKYFVKAEDAQLEYADPHYHSTGGPLSVRDVPYRTESVHAFVRGAQEAGHQRVDYNGKEQIGVSYVQATIRHGHRWSAERAYLNPAKNRPNLTILKKSRVVEVLINPQTKTAYGVKYVRNRKYHIARASKEVVLSAGAFNSPQLLMLSGVGPKKDLEELGIPVVQDLPVGKKLYDHLCFTGLYFVLNETVGSDQAVAEDITSFAKFAKYGNGPLTTLGGVEALTYIKTNVSTDPKPYPDVELIYISGSLSSDNGLNYKKTFRYRDDVYNAVWKPTEGKHTWSVFPMLLKPKSYGHLKLKSRNPYHWPKLYGNFLTHPDDLKTFIAAIREVQRIARMPALKRYGSEMVRAIVPGCEAQKFDSDAYWECAVRHLATTLHHQVSTCKMGPASDPEAVVDNKLRVYGIKKLRVVDTSIIPIPPTAHINVPAFMIGEKASDMIKEDWLNTGSVNIDPK